jgi:endonuclease/exonuclease/phosphatase family metal-dependent hydrolase
MVRALRISLALFLLTLIAANADAQSASLRVLHWNVLHSGSGTDGVLDRARQVAWIVRMQPDVVTLNEVTDSAAEDYLARVRLASGREWFLHHAAATRGGDGNAILSRYRMLATDRRLLTRSRSVAQATLDVNGKRVNVFATHLESRDESEARAEQAALLLPYMAKFATPRILAGDFNATPDKPEIQPLFASYVDAWDRAVRNRTATAYPDNPPNRYTRTRGTRLDYILVSDEGSLRVSGCNIPDLRDRADANVTTKVRTSDDRGVRPSDHNLITCVLSLAGAAPRPTVPRPPPPRPSPEVPRDDEPPSSSGDVVLWAGDAEDVQGWTHVPDADAAGGLRLTTLDAGVAIVEPLATPDTYFDVTFAAEAGRPYRLWVRGLAHASFRLNDSVYVQFSDSVTAEGEPIFRIGTTSATPVILEEFLHAGLSGWAWADNGWDSFGPEIYFETSGRHTLRVQLRQDGVSVDQIVLSPDRYLWRPPGATKEDRTILGRTKMNE